MKSKALDSNNDIIIENGSFKLVEDAEEVSQHVRSRLLMYLGEWFLDTQAGVPYFQQIFVKPVNLANVESILKSRILQTPEVLQLNSFSMNFDTPTRNLSVSFSAETEFGTITVENEVISG